MRPEFTRAHFGVRPRPGQSRSLALASVLVACSVVSCNTENERTPLGGGPGVVVHEGTQTDGGRDAGAAGQGGKGGKGGGTAGNGGVGGAAGRGGAGGRAGAGGVAGASATGGAGGGASGGAAQMDPCRACQLRRCTNPQSGDDSAVISYSLCFLDQPVPTVELPLCGDPDHQGDRVTSGGDHPGTSKAALCQAVLACIASSQCAGPLGTDDFDTCFCGAGVTVQQCTAASFAPQGPCAAAIAAGSESTSNPAITLGFSNACLASGAAFFAYTFCYESCCSKECLGVDPPPGVDDSSCNANSASGSGGVSGTGGVTGTGGTVVTTGSGGSVSTGGTAGAGTGGTNTGTGGGMTGGSGGATLPPVFQFNGSTAPWTASYGATISYSSTDASASSTSGALDLTLANGNASIASLVSATLCVQVAAGAYDLSGQVFVPQGMLGSIAGLAIWAYTSADCSSGLTGTFSSPQVATTSTWQSVTASAQAPAGTQSISLRLTVTKPAGKTVAEALFDDVLVLKR